MRPLNLTPPGGPVGWPHGGISHADALEVLSRQGKHPPLVLGLDQAADSGWALLDPVDMTLVSSGVASGTAEQVSVLEQLGTLAEFDWRGVLVCFEDHSEINHRQRFVGGKPQRNPVITAIGLGDARGRWHCLLDLRAHPKSQRIQATPAEWRRVFSGARLQRADWKEAARRWASAYCKRAIRDDNEAEAIAIARWTASEGLCRFATERLRERAAATRARRTEGSAE